MNSPQQTQPSLDLLSQSFKDWRDTRTQHKIPEHLKQQTLDALSFYTCSAVIKATGLNHATLKKWRSKTEAAKPSSRFIAVLPQAESPQKEVELTFTHNQHRVSLRGPFSIDELQSLVISLQGLAQ